MNKDFHIERTATALASVYDCRKYMYQYHTIHRPSSQQTTGCGSWVKLVIELGRVMGHEGQRSVIQWSHGSWVMSYGGQRSIVHWSYGSWIMGHWVKSRLFNWLHGSWVMSYGGHTGHGSWVTGSKVDCSMGYTGHESWVTGS